MRQEAHSINEFKYKNYLQKENAINAKFKYDIIYKKNAPHGAFLHINFKKLFHNFHLVQKPFCTSKFIDDKENVFRVYHDIST